jgi:hypothetical protein
MTVWIDLREVEATSGGIIMVCPVCNEEGEPYKIGVVMELGWIAGVHVYAGTCGCCGTHCVRLARATKHEVREFAALVGELDHSHGCKVFNNEELMHALFRVP